MREFKASFIIPQGMREDELWGCIYVAIENYEFPKDGSVNYKCDVEFVTNRKQCEETTIVIMERK